MSGKSNKRKQKNVAKVARTLKGFGDYNMNTDEFNKLVTRLARIEDKIPSVKTGLSGLGSKVGGLFGMGELGKNLGEGAAKLLGFGDYKVQSNSLMKGMEQNAGDSIPKFSTPNNGVRIIEREFIGDIISSDPANTFLNQPFRINPADSGTFPWLSTIASQFDQWRPNGIVFEFRTTSSDFNGSAQGLGSVIMSTDYDVNDPVYTNKSTMTNADYACSTKPSNDLYHGIECDPKQRPTELLYVLSANSADQSNLYSLGNFQIATNGVSAAAVTLGELWVSYDITLYKKQINVDFFSWSNITYDMSAANVMNNIIIAPDNAGYWKFVQENDSDMTIYFPPYLKNVVYQVQIFQACASGFCYPSTHVDSYPFPGTSTTVQSQRASLMNPPTADTKATLRTQIVYVHEENASVRLYNPPVIGFVVSYSLSIIRVDPTFKL